LIEPPFRSGDFVWSNFPERENPARPGGRHIAYTLAVTGVASAGGATQSMFALFAAYATSQPWTAGTKPPGVYEFSQDAAAAMGQSRPFTVDLRRVAAIPITSEWFPELDTPHRGIVGRAPEQLRMRFEEAAKSLFRRGIVEQLGPLWPNRR
jgi:hypothetical protein